MQFEFELTHDEYMEACKALARQKGRRGIQRTGIALAAFAFFLLLKSTAMPAWIAPVILCATGIGIAILPSWRATTAIEDIWQRAQDRVRMVSVNVTPEGIAKSRDGTSSTTAWRMIDQMVETRHLFILYSDYAAGEISDLFPKRAFRDAKDTNDFRSLAKEKLTRVAGAFPIQPARTAEHERTA